MAAVEAHEVIPEEAPAQVAETIPVAQPAELPDIKLFGRWSCDDVGVSDISLHVIICLTAN